MSVRGGEMNPRHNGGDRWRSFLVGIHSIGDPPSVFLPPLRVRALLSNLTRQPVLGRAIGQSARAKLQQ